jgi:hypothetical protein
LDPWPLTIRELAYAAEKRQEAQWDHTAELLAMQANLHAEGKYQRNQFHPMRHAAKTNLDDPAATYRQLVAKNGS